MDFRQMPTKKAWIFARAFRGPRRVGKSLELKRAVTTFRESRVVLTDSSANDLVSAFLAWHCYRIQDGRPNTAAQRKLYFVDPLIARLPHLRDPTTSCVHV